MTIDLPLTVLWIVSAIHSRIVLDSGLVTPPILSDHVRNSRSAAAGERPMGEQAAKRLILALVLGVVLGMIFDDSAIGMALGFAIVFGAGLFTAKT
jgi:hypothetical protein